MRLKTTTPAIYKDTDLTDKSEFRYIDKNEVNKDVSIAALNLYNHIKTKDYLTARDFSRAIHIAVNMHEDNTRCYWWNIDVRTSLNEIACLCQSLVLIIGKYKPSKGTLTITGDEFIQLFYYGFESAIYTSRRHKEKLGDHAGMSMQIERIKENYLSLYQSSKKSYLDDEEYHFYIKGFEYLCTLLTSIEKYI